MRNVYEQMITHMFYDLDLRPDAWYNVKISDWKNRTNLISPCKSYSKIRQNITLKKISHWKNIIQIIFWPKWEHNFWKKYDFGFGEIIFLNYFLSRNEKIFLKKYIISKIWFRQILFRLDQKILNNFAFVQKVPKYLVWLPGKYR